MTIDANIVIAYLAGDKQVISTLSDWRERGLTLFLSTVVETEVLSFSGWSAREFRAIEVFLLENFTSIPFDRPVAAIAASIRRSTKTKFPDAAIAATALFTRTPPVTRNLRDFKAIAGLRIVTL